MANVSKMSAPNAPEAAPGHAASAFFQVLTPEIRLNIYKKAVQGASVQATLTMEDDPSDGSKRHLVRFQHSKHFQRLRRCRKFYEEALTTYWSQAVLNLVQLYIIANSPAKSCEWLKDVDYKADDYAYHLCNTLPEVVKTNVKHVRGMMLPPLHGRFLKKNPELTPTAMLSGFKSLVTCDISPTMLDHPEVAQIATNVAWTKSIIKHNSGINNENDQTDSVTRGGRFKSFYEQVYYEPKDLVRKICGIDATAEVVFLVTLEIAMATVEFEVRPSPGLPGALATSNLGLAAGVPARPPRTVFRSHSKKEFWNLSNGIFCEVDPKKVGDEEGYDIVIRGGPEFEVAGGQTGWR